MDRLNVFSQKLGIPVPITNVGTSIKRNFKASMFEWSNGGWNNYSDNWLNEGWNNYSSGWMNEGWNNYSSGWTNDGWNNYSSGWTNDGWNTYSYSDSDGYDGGK